MDINYWIILLIIYLISLWVRKRVHRTRGPQTPGPAPERRRDMKKVGEEGIPDWLRKLGLVEPEEEEETPPGTQTLREEIETFDEKVIYPGEVFISEKEPSIQPEEKLKEKLSKSAPREEVKKRLSELRSELRVPQKAKEFLFGNGRLIEMIHQPENLRDVIVLREILGTPRGMKRHRYRLHF